MLRLNPRARSPAFEAALALVDALRSLPAGASEASLVRLLDDPSLRHLSAWAVHRPERYTRLVLARENAIEVALLGWGPDQGTPIHDHSGLRCGLVILEGSLVEERFTPSGSVPILRRELNPLDRVACAPGDRHRVRNLSFRPAVSLHLYAEAEPRGASR